MPPATPHTSKQQLGQFFTVDPQIHELVRRLTTPQMGGLWLEPSAGGGDLVRRREDDLRPITIVEFDQALASALAHRFTSAQVLPGCFFAASIQPGSVGSAIGNPPYVSWTSYRSVASPALQQYVAKRGFGGKTNLVYPFLDRVAHLLSAPGEMIMIVPKDFSTASSARPLREYFAAHGVFTHWIDCGETPHFPDAQLESLVIFRWEKRTLSPQTRPVSAPRVQWAESVEAALAGTWESREEIFSGTDQLLLLLPPQLHANLGNEVIGDQFEVLVSAVTGYDAAFRTPAGLRHLPQSQLFQAGQGQPIELLNTNQLERLEDADPALVAHLQQHRKALDARYGADPVQWWKWATIRNAEVTMKPQPKRGRIFVLSQTRQAPFFVGPRIGFVGSVYGMFPHDRQISDADLSLAVKILNSPTYRSLYQASGLGVRDKFRCTPRALTMVPFPSRDRWREVATSLTTSTP